MMLRPTEYLWTLLQNKCDQYWPEKSTESYNDFTVTCKDKQTMSDFTFHTLIVEKVTVLSIKFVNTQGRKIHNNYNNIM